jgi:DNA polymerase-3 subunit alpha
MSFVHLNIHTHYSVLKAFSKPVDYVLKAKKLGMKALAITDFGALYGVIEFYNLCKENGIKPIIGCDFIVASLGRFNRTTDNKHFGLILFAKNNNGYKNLLKLATIAHLEGFYYQPRLDLDILSKYSDGLIALSSWKYGEITHKALNSDNDGVIESINKYQQIFGKDNFFIEIQNHSEETFNEDINKKLLEISEKTQVDLIATNGCLYVNKDDQEAYDAFSCIDRGKIVKDEDRERLHGDYSLKSSEEMRQSFSFCEKACDMTLKIIDMIDIKLEFGQNLLPIFKTPDDSKSIDYLKILCNEGLKKKYGEIPSDEAKKRLIYELEIIDKMGFASYFLIVWDFIKFAKERGIVVGPGRGSAASSIISYCLDITTLDPLKYNLLFERFLNPERISMPDIDVDFSDYRRDEVLQYVISKYGEKQVAQIITFGTMGAKAAIRDAGRVLGFLYSEVDKIAKMVPPPVLGKYRPLKMYIEEVHELKKVYESSVDTKKILDIAVRFEGTIRNIGTHACAVVISPCELTEFVAIQKSVSDKGGIVTQFSMKPIEKLGLLKMDFLGLSNLTILENVIKIIKRTKNIDINLDTLPLDDAKAFELFQKGLTTGIFQFESAGMKKYLKDLKPNELEDLIAMNSLYRPGPMQFIPDYINGKHGKKKITYLHHSLKEILEPTYGIAIYQEQILQLAQKFAAFTLGEADLLRRAIGKKNPVELASQREKFINGAINNGYNKKIAVKIFDEVIEPFAGYGFNKAHAACYSLIAYQTAYLKTHFTAEFMAALLSSDSGNLDRIAIEIMDCEDLGIKVLPPLINSSLAHFTVVDDVTIRFGLCAIKGLGENTARQIIKIREEGGPFLLIEDFAKRIPAHFLNKKTLEALIFSGTLDCFGEQNELAASIELISNYAKNEQASKASGQMDLFGLMGNSQISKIVLNKAEKTSEFDKLRREKDFLGIYVTGHPLFGLKKYFEKKVRLLNTIKKSDIGKNIKLGGLITSLKKITTRTNAIMLTFTIEDPTGLRIDVVLFPKAYIKIGNIFKENEIVFMDGKLDTRADKTQFICNDGGAYAIKEIIDDAKKTDLFDVNEKRDERPVLLQEELNHDELNLGMDMEDAQIQALNYKGEDIYNIEIPKDLNVESMDKLKKLLIANKNDDGVRIKLKFSNNDEIILPIKIVVSPELEMQINEILGKTRKLV